MKLRDFDEWIIENNFENNELFKESLECYCNQAYKSAYMFSYLAFIEFLKNSILNYQGIPVRFEEKWRDRYEKKNGCAKSEEQKKKHINDEWQKIKNDLSNEDDWEETLKNLVMEEEYNIFCYDKKIRTEFETKKNNRNVCAHNKERIISNATVEDLWDFIVYIKPLSTINGASRYAMKLVDDIIQCCNMSEYKEKANEVYKYYIQLFGTEKHTVFSNLCKKINLYYYSDSNQFLIELFELIFAEKDVEEYQWLADNFEAELFLKINVNNYSKELDKIRLYQFIEKRDNDWSRFNLYAPTTIIKNGRRVTLIKKFLLEIYNSENHYTNWCDMLLASDDWEEFVNDSEIVSVVQQMDNVTAVLKEIKKLYTYNNGFVSNKETNTFDYCNFTSDNKISRKVMLLLILTMKGKIDIENTDIKDLIIRCKRIIAYAGTDTNCNYMSENFKKNVVVYNWLLGIKM